MPEMNTYRDLEIFNEAKRLAIVIHQLSVNLPKFELYEEGSQIRRSSKAIAVMIVEGYGRRRYKADFIKYLVYALCECDETIVHLDFLRQTNSLVNAESHQTIRDQYEILSKRINAYLQWVEENWNPPS